MVKGIKNKEQDEKANKSIHNNTEIFYEELYDIHKVNSLHKPPRPIANTICRLIK